MACCRHPDLDVRITETAFSIITSWRCRNCGATGRSTAPKIKPSKPGGKGGRRKK